MSEGQEQSGRRKGRGRLSSIDLLPEDADEAIAWANAELREKRMPQTEILRQFNAMLADHALGPISKGAFSRYSVRKAVELRRMDASRKITDAMLAKLGPEERSDSTIGAVELLKHRTVELVMGTEEISGKELAAVTLALNRLSAIAKREKEARRADRKEEREDKQRRLEQEQRDREETAETVEKIATEAGLGAERISAIRKDVLGLAA
ncbi:MAG: DUF3486 family protein [Sphingomonadaceae bacterium]|nr:DUF3486 family protein [Sphingomonadaceae bacterium]